MDDSIAATMLAHPSDWEFATALAERVVPGSIAVEVRNALTFNPLRDRSAGLLILLITPSLTGADAFPGLIELLGISPRHEDMLILTRDVRSELSALPGAQRASLDDWESEDLMRGPAYILRWMVSRGFSADVPEATSNEIMAKLLSKVADLPFTSRTQAALRSDNIIYVGDLVMRTEAELLRMLGFGRKSLQDVKAGLHAIGLRLGLDIPEWPPANIEQALLDASTAERVATLEQTRGGARFEPVEDRFAMIVEGDLDDRSVALQPMTQQMHSAVREKAHAFAGLAQRLDNQPGWTGIGRSSSALAHLLDRRTETVPDILGLLYPAAIELGSFLELDQQLASAQDSYAAPLEPEMRRPLGDLVRSLAPWLRAFPSVRVMDDEASQFLVQAAALTPVMEVVQSARDCQLLSEADIEVFTQLRDAAERGAFQAGKAGGRAQRSATNLVIRSAAFLGTFFVGAVSSDYATTSPLVHKAGQFLTQSERAISELVADAAPDLQQAIRAFVRDLAERPILPGSPPPVVREAMPPSPARRRRRSMTVS
jgi:hypothetical protein